MILNLQMFIGKYDVLVNCIIELACQQLAEPTKILAVLF